MRTARQIPSQTRDRWKEKSPHRDFNTSRTPRRRRIMWKRTEGQQKDLLEELCGDDSRLRDFLSVNLCENPIVAISSSDLDTLIEDAEKSGDYRPALDKAIFEGSQNLKESENYVVVIRNLASRTIDATKKEIERAEKEGLAARAASLETRIESQAFMVERAADIISIASKFYTEKLLVVGEEARREARARDRRAAEVEGRRMEILEQAGRATRQTETKKMMGEEKKEAERQGKREELAAMQRKAVREEERRRAEDKEKRIGDLERSGRETRGKERNGAKPG
jgi:hypothetical protein